ncbi:hypothetical protein HXX01_03665 [Candidatus Nomurabacteria bacterium]|nr:hypothetical protein [Candidatus Nomurabacteria bacterium]
MFIFVVGIIVTSVHVSKTNAVVSGSLDVSAGSDLNNVAPGTKVIISWGSSPDADYCTNREGIFSGPLGGSGSEPYTIQATTTFTFDCYKAAYIPPPVCYSYTIGADTCFVADTKVILADGSTKNIQDVKIGDVLKGESTNNTVLGFHQPKLNGKLYSFNGGRYFVTEEHPFKTTNGWKSINPKKTANENIGIKVTELKVGDTLITDTGHVLLKTVKSKVGKDDTQLYNFKLDGDHTYYADGYLVHNKGFCNDGNPSHVCGNGQVCYMHLCLACPQSCITGYTGECSGDATTICREDATCSK